MNLELWPEPRHLPLVDGRLTLWPDWLAPDPAASLFAQLRDELAWEQSVIQIHGREVLIPRLNAWYGDPGASYTYSHRRFEPLPFPAGLAGVRTRVATTTGATFNSVLANYYRDGNDSMGWHSDDEPELGPDPSIASVSLGGERRFSLRHRRRKDLSTIHIVLPPGSLLLMDGPTQHHWRHQVAKTARPAEPRINLTFRLVRFPTRARFTPA